MKCKRKKRNNKAVRSPLIDKTNLTETSNFTNEMLKTKLSKRPTIKKSTLSKSSNNNDMTRMKTNSATKTTFNKSKTSVTQKSQQSLECESSLKTRKAFLRPRKIGNYADILKQDDFSDASSEEIPAISKIDIKKKNRVPIYLSTSQTNSNSEDPCDPFEFVVDTLAERKQRLADKRAKDKIRNSDCNSDSDLSIHFISKALRKKLDREACNIGEKSAVNKNSTNKIKNLNVVIKENKTGTDKNKSLESKLVRIEENEEDTYSDNEEGIGNDISDNEMDFLGFDFNNIEGNNTANIFASPANISTDSLPKTQKTSQMLSSTPIVVGQDNTHQPPNSNLKILSVVVIPSTSYSKSISEEFNENIFLDETPRHQNINTLNSSQTPWRTNDSVIVRNPHFLYMKNTSLPCYNQEMVLDSKLLEKPVNNVSKTPQHTEVTKVQTEILDYFNSSNIINEETFSLTKPSSNCSLFDVDNFSPIKNKSSRKTKSKSPVKNNDFNNDKENKEVSNAKHNIFESPSGSPLKTNTRLNCNLSEVSNNLHNYFGFDDLTPRENPKKKATRNRNAYPTRLNVNLIDKFTKNTEKNINLKTNDDSTIENVNKNGNTRVNNNLSDLPEDNSGPTIGLFEDLIQFSTKKYTRKRPKRVRLKSVASEDEDEPLPEMEKHKRKKKDERSKLEEREYNKWAKQFNIMCEEIEKHELETA